MEKETVKEPVENSLSTSSSPLSPSFSVSSSSSSPFSSSSSSSSPSSSSLSSPFSSPSPIFESETKASSLDSLGENKETIPTNGTKGESRSTKSAHRVTFADQVRGMERSTVASSELVPPSSSSSPPRPVVINTASSSASSISDNKLKMGGEFFLQYAEKLKKLAEKIHHAGEELFLEEANFAEQTGGNLAITASAQNQALLASLHLNKTQEFMKGISRAENKLLAYEELLMTGFDFEDEEKDKKGEEKDEKEKKREEKDEKDEKESDDEKGGTEEIPPDADFDPTDSRKAKQKGLSKEDFSWAVFELVYKKDPETGKEEWEEMCDSSQSSKITMNSAKDTVCIVFSDPFLAIKDLVTCSADEKYQKLFVKEKTLNYISLMKTNPSAVSSSSSSSLSSASSLSSSSLLSSPSSSLLSSASSLSLSSSPLSSSSLLSSSQSEEGKFVLGDKIFLCIYGRSITFS